MTDGAFKATLALYAWQAENIRPSSLLIDATLGEPSPHPSRLGQESKHRFG